MNTERFQLKFKHQLLILVFLAFAINANTLFHEYVLDDVIVLTENITETSPMSSGSRILIMIGSGCVL